MKGLLQRNIVSLCIAQLFGMMASIIAIFVGALVGLHLAPHKLLTTLPVAALVIGAALAAYPSAYLMQRVGRKWGNILACFLAILGAIISAVALRKGHFYWFSFGICLIGMNNAFVQQYRFAVIEGLSFKMRSFGVSVLVFANAFSAFFGTEIAVHAKYVIDAPYTGSMLGACLVLCVSLLGLFIYRTPIVNDVKLNQAMPDCQPSPLTANIAPSIIIVCLAYFMMAWLMVAMPVSMHELHIFSTKQIGFVMQSHLMAMFLPSLVTGIIASKIGNINVVLIGCGVLLLALISNITGVSLQHYWVGLVLLGIGWNFTFICGTTILTESYLHEHRFRYQGVNDALVFSLNALASLLAGFCVLKLGWNCLNGICIAVLLVMVASGMRILFQLKRKNLKPA